MVSDSLSCLNCDDKDQEMRETLAQMASLFKEELITSVTIAVTATMNAMFTEEKENMTATMNAMFTEEKENMTTLFKELSKLNERVKELEVFISKYDVLSHTLSPREVGNKAP